MRKFHIDEFPQDRIFVLLKEEYHRELFHFIKWNYGFKKLNKLFNNKLNWNTYRSWQRRQSKIKTRFKRHFLPLWFVIKLAKILNIKIEEIEKNIVEYKGPSSSNPIRNSNLPLVEDKQLLKIVAHMLGDGSVGGGFGSKLPKGKQHSEYRNFAPELLDQFEKDLAVFGDVIISKNYEHGHIIISNSIGYILQHIYNIKFDSFNSSLPEVLSELPKELSAAFIRAFADDEAHVYDNHIDFYSVNRAILEQLRSLFQAKFPEIKVSELKANKKCRVNTKYYFYVLAESREAYYDLIGFDSKEKNESILFNIARGSSSKPKSKSGEFRQKILTTLSENELTAKELSRNLNVSHGNVLRVLRSIKNIEIAGKTKHGANVWRLVNFK